MVETNGIMTMHKMKDTGSSQAEINIGEASVDPGVSLDALALANNGEDKQRDPSAPGTFSASAGHASDFSFILAIGSPDSVKSTITIDPTIFFDTSLLDSSDDDDDDEELPIPEIQQSHSFESSTNKSTTGNPSPRRKFRPPANANRWMDDSEHPKSVCSRTSYMGILGLSNHLVPILDTDEDNDNEENKSHHEYHNSKNSSFAEVASSESSSAFEAGSVSTSESFAYAPYNDERSADDQRDLTLKMQQLRATAGATGTLGDADDDENNGITQFNPSNKSPYMDSLHSLNTLISQDNILCNTTGHSTSTSGTFTSED